jgi:nitrogen regulatory protein PII
MTKIEAVVREQRIGAVVERLGLLGVHSLSIYAVRSAGPGEQRRLAIRGRTVSVAFVRKVMLEWCGPDDQARSIVRAIRHCADLGEPGDCTIFLQSAEAVDSSDPQPFPVERVAARASPRADGGRASLSRTS